MNDVNTNDFAIKCESLSLDYDAPIIAIGAIAFDHTTGKTGQTFYAEISMASAIQHSRPAADTMLAWLTRNPRAREIFCRPDSEKKSLSTALYEFMQWLRTTGKGVPVVWANGSQHDIAWLQHALHVSSVGTYAAWSHLTVRDATTLVLMAEEIQGDDKVASFGHPKASNALEDATFMAGLITHSYKLLGGKPAYVEPAKPLRGKIVKPTPPPTDDEEI